MWDSGSLRCCCWLTRDNTTASVDHCSTYPALEVAAAVALEERKNSEEALQGLKAALCFSGKTKEDRRKERSAVLGVAVVDDPSLSDSAADWTSLVAVHLTKDGSCDLTLG